VKPPIYLLVFDPYKTDAAKMHSLITDMPYALEWWHYIGSAYIFTSRSDADVIQRHIHERWEGYFYVSEITASNSGGWLPEEAWNWINERR
jgi:hypothetical protein